MADYAPPAGPPPPRVPEGWKAVWNDQYKEWFYVNTFTKESTWEKPTAPVHPPGDTAPAGAPPPYDHSSKPSDHPAEKGSNPYRQQGESDEALARRLQAEENARVKSSGPSAESNRGESDSYYGSAAQQQQPQQQYGQSSSQYTPQGQYGQGAPASSQDQGKKGLFSKLTGLGSSRPPQQYQSNYGPPQQHYPQQGYGYPPQQPGYGYGPGPGYGGYPPQQAYAQQRPQKSGIGMGGLAMGAGAGLLGGMLIGEAIEHHEDEERYGDDGGGYGGDDGGGYGGDDGGGFGGDDGGGGDF